MVRTVRRTAVRDDDVLRGQPQYLARLCGRRDRRGDFVRNLDAGADAEGLGMSIRKVVGWLLLTSPFVVIFVTATIEHGVLFAVSVFVAVALLITVIVVGTELIDL